MTEILTRDRCYACNGTGEAPGSGSTCMTCEGKGYFEQWVTADDFLDSYIRANGLLGSVLI